MGAKGARLTGLPSLAGRYLVLVPDSDSQGISRRLPEGERLRLREVLAQVKPDGFGVIVRTAAMHASTEEIAADIDRLVKVWSQIQAESEGGGAPRMVYEEPDLLIRVIREHFTPDFRRLLIDDTDAYEQVCTYLRATAPDLVSKVSRYDEEMPLFERYHVEDQLRKALDRRVFLPSGRPPGDRPNRGADRHRRQYRPIRRFLQPGGDRPAEQSRGGRGDRSPTAIA